jgi:D-sedoheptulose 7-phosphate isomerase
VSPARGGVQTIDLSEAMDRAFARRAGAAAALLDEGSAIVLACRAIAQRFRGGATLITFGNGASATDAEHIAVEFLHPVIVGKRALPAVSLTGDVAALSDIATRTGWNDVFSSALRSLARPHDIALGISADGRCVNVARALATAKTLGLVTVALTGGAAGTPVARAADHAVLVRSREPLVVKEMIVTVYHILWELVHVLLDQPAGAGVRADS